jgi:hypothetical protein
LLAFSLAGCTTPDQGTIEGPSEIDASQTPVEDPRFSLEIDPDGCSPAEELPVEYAAPEDIGYREEFTTPNFHESLSCTYWGAQGTEALDVVESTTFSGGSVKFTITDDLPPWPESYLDGSLDFTEFPMASYFQDWRDSSQRMEIDDYMENNTVILFTLFTSMDNLYLEAHLGFVVPDEIALYGDDQILKAELATAAYEILDVIVPPVVDGLERE